MGWAGDSLPTCILLLAPQVRPVARVEKVNEECADALLDQKGSVVATGVDMHGNTVEGQHPMAHLSGRAQVQGRDAVHYTL